MHSLPVASGSHLQILIPILFIGNAFLLPLIASRLKQAIRWWSTAITGIVLLLSINLLGQILAAKSGYLDYFP